MVGRAIFGTGGFGRDILPLVRAQVGTDHVVFVQDRVLPEARYVNGARVVSFDEFASKEFDGWKVAVAVADVRSRRDIVQRLSAVDRGSFSIFAPTFLMYDHVDIAEGAIFCDFSMCTVNIKIGRHFHGNIYSYVEHDCVIGDFVTFAPRVNCNGNVVIEDDVYVGTAAILKQGRSDKPLRIGRGSIIGMGAVVTKDVAPGTTMVGNPARPKIGRPPSATTYPAVDDSDIECYGQFK